MAPNKLPAICLDQIFRYLEDDAKNLFSCLLVNWEWCDIAVRILWINPWQFDKQTSDYSFWTAITPTILCCLSQDSQEILRKNNIIKYDLIRPSYDYVIYCQYLTPEAVDQLTREHISDHSTDHRGYKDHLFEQEIYKLFMSKTSLKHLVLPKAPLSYCPGSTTCLQKLYELVCGSDISQEFFYGLAQICRHIQKLVIDPCNDNEGLAALIEFQTGLKYVELQAPDGQDNEYPRIGQALMSQAHSISTLYFHGGLCIKPTLLAKFINLKKLKLFISGKISNLSQFATTSFPKLEVLDIFWDEHTPFDIFTQFIGNTQGSLSRIYWNTDYPPTKPEEIRNYLDVVSKPKFTNLKFVTVWWSSYATDKLERFLTIQQQLQAIKIYTSTKTDGRDLFNLLIRGNSSCYLRILNLDGEWQFTPEDLVEFLDQWKLTRRKPLSIYIPNRFDDTPYFEEIIKRRYKEEGILKDFRKIEFLDEVESLNYLWKY